MSQEHGLIFTPEHAREIRRGLKTQTRRLVTAHTSLVDGTGKGIRKMWPELRLDGEAWVDKGPSPAGNAGPYIKAPHRNGDTVHRVYSRIYPGDRVYVREDWAGAKGLDDLRASELPEDSLVVLKAAVPEGQTVYQGKWRKALHMPRWASQTWLEVTELRAQPIRKIAHYDIRAEGVGCPEHDFAGGFCTSHCGYLVAEFAKLWDEINGDRAPFESDPWVWCYTFKLVQV